MENGLESSGAGTHSINQYLTKRDSAISDDAWRQLEQKAFAAIIHQTDNWVNKVVIGCNFCPFAAKSVLQKKIRYVVFSGETLETALETVLTELQYLDETAGIETTLIIFPKYFEDFDAYLDLAEAAEDMSIDEGYEGIYQIASFHPDYCFDGATDDDPANYTNRSPYPMLHLLREDTLTKVLDHYIDPEGIPERNIAFAKEKGLEYMQALLASCLVGDGERWTVDGGR